MKSFSSLLFIIQGIAPFAYSFSFNSRLSCGPAHSIKHCMTIKSSHEQKTALVTGATDGIGLHTATKLAIAGYFVYIHGRWNLCLIFYDTVWYFHIFQERS